MLLVDLKRHNLEVSLLIFVVHSFVVVEYIVWYFDSFVFSLLRAGGGTVSL